MKTTEKALFEHISYFTDFSPHRHFGNLDALNICANDLQSFFEDLGLEVIGMIEDYHFDGFDTKIAPMFMVPWESFDFVRT